MRNLKTFEAYSDEYGTENFTYDDLEFAKELYQDGMTNPVDIAREMDHKDMTESTVKQMIAALKSQGEI